MQWNALFLTEPLPQFIREIPPSFHFRGWDTGLFTPCFQDVTRPTQGLQIFRIMERPDKIGFTGRRLSEPDRWDFVV